MRRVGRREETGRSEKVERRAEVCGGCEEMEGRKSVF
jgi:hypothetical protein